MGGGQAAHGEAAEAGKTHDEANRGDGKARKLPSGQGTARAEQDARREEAGDQGARGGQEFRAEARHGEARRRQGRGKNHDAEEAERQAETFLFARPRRRLILGAPALRRQSRNIGQVSPRAPGARSQVARKCDPLGRYFRPGAIAACTCSRSRCAF
jgi:hypothetical protein